MKHLILLLLFALGAALPARAQVAVVAHPSVSDAAVDAGTLLDIYSLDRGKWSDGARVVAFVLEDATADVFFGHIGRGHADLKKVWLRKKLSGEGQPPEGLSTPAALLAKVAATPGAVGFVPASAVDGAVKVVATLK